MLDRLAGLLLKDPDFKAAMASLSSFATVARHIEAHVCADPAACTLRARVAGTLGVQG